MKMIVLWIRKNGENEPSRSGGNEEESFQKHDDHMKKFRVGHPRIETVKPKKASLSDCLELIPIQEVKLASYSHN